MGRVPKCNVGDKVFARFWYGSRRWRIGVIVAIAGPLSYDVQIGSDVHRRHATDMFHDRGVIDPKDEDRRCEEMALAEFTSKPCKADLSTA